jgi:hypothetical protein
LQSRAAGRKVARRIGHFFSGESMPDDLAGDGGRDWTWRSIVDLVLGVAMLLLAFIGIGASDVSGAGSQAYWSFLAIGFGVASVTLDWIHGDEDDARALGTLRLAAHWVGVLVAIQLVYVFIASGRLANADVGLVNGALLALGTFLCGVHADWRLAVVGAALALTTAAVAYLEQYLWVMFALAVVALVAAIWIGRLRRRGAT